MGSQIDDPGADNYDGPPELEVPETPEVVQEATPEVPDPPPPSEPEPAPPPLTADVIAEGFAKALQKYQLHQPQQMTPQQPEAPAWERDPVAYILQDPDLSNEEKAKHLISRIAEIAEYKSAQKVKHLEQTVANLADRFLKVQHPDEHQEAINLLNTGAIANYDVALELVRLRKQSSTGANGTEPQRAPMKAAASPLPPRTATSPASAGSSGTKQRKKSRIKSETPFQDILDNDPELRAVWDKLPR